MTPLTPGEREPDSEETAEVPPGSGVSYKIEEPDSVTDHPDTSFTSQTQPSQTKPSTMQPSQTFTPKTVPPQQDVPAYFPARQTNTEFHPFQQPSFAADQTYTGFCPGYQQQSAESFTEYQQSEGTFPSDEATAGSFPSGQESGHPNTGFFSGPQPAEFLTEIQPAAGQISAKSITAAHISTSSFRAVGGSLRAKQICAAFIGQEPGHQPFAGSITAGKLSADSITTGPSSAGPIIAGELHVSSIGPGQSSVE